MVSVIVEIVSSGHFVISKKRVNPCVKSRFGQNFLVVTNTCHTFVTVLVFNRTVKSKVSACIPLVCRRLRKKITGMTNMKHCLVIAASLLVVSGCQRRPLEFADEGCEVRFSAGGLDVSGVATKADVFLEAGSTVRVVAYRRAAGGAAPDLSKDTYVDSKTYKVQSDGTSMVACDVDADGKEVTGGTPQGMELSNGTYDFYAYSPARKIETDNRTVKGIANGVDFLGCLKSGAIINKTSSKVELLFNHKCSKVSFAVKFADELVGTANQGLELKKVTLKGMVAGPVDYTVGGNLPVGVGLAGNVVEIGVVDKTTAGDHKDPADATGATEQISLASGLVLPKGNVAAVGGDKVTGEFVLTMGGTDYTLVAKDMDLTFAAGNHYKFTMKSNQAVIELTMTVAPWATPTWGTDTDLGDVPESQFTVGAWSNPNWGTDGTLGDFLEASGGGTIGTWVPNTWTGNVGQ